MRLFVHKIIAVFLITQCFYAQDVTSVLTKIERNANVGTLEDYYDLGLAPFYHGVASGDPLEDAVIIWTRVTSNEPNVLVSWKIAEDPAMNQVVKQGQISTNQNKDYTVKIDVRELSPFTTYYYQFEALGVPSVIGQTKTAPARETRIDNARFAVVSCSNYQNGYFNTYNQIAERNDIDAVLHLGDYIYEYESGGYGYSDDIGRGHIPQNEVITLDDYRVRYSFYKLDPMLRNVHGRHPFIHIWDDHEFANDANKFGAENHTPSTEGSWETRKNNAYKAYFEWMPVRANSIEQYRLYRTISYGKLLDLIMLDTRIEGRETQVNSSKNLISAAASNSAFKDYVKNVISKKDLSNINDVKEILNVVLPRLLTVSGNENKEEGLTKEEFSKVVEYFADAVVNKRTGLEEGKSNFELERLLSKGVTFDQKSNTKDSKATYTSILGLEQFNWLTKQLSSSQAKWKVIGNQVMVMPWNGVPSDDAWDGYEEERNRLLKHIRDNDINNIVVLTGDIHSTFAGEVRYRGNCEMCEFVVPSVTSQNLDFLGGGASGIAEFYIKLLNRHIKDVDLDNHGYYVLDVKEDRVQADWFDIKELATPQSGETRSRSWYVNADDCNVRKASRASVASNNRVKDIQPENIKEKPVLKEDFTVLGVYPNPLERQGNIHYLVHKNTNVVISLHDMQGKVVRDLHKQELLPGIYNLSFEADLQPGNYIVLIKTNTSEASRKIIVK